MNFPAIQKKNAQICVCGFVHFQLVNETMLIAFQCLKFATDASSIDMNHHILKMCLAGNLITG